MAYGLSPLGYVQVGLEIAQDLIIVKPKRQIGEFVAQVTIEEAHVDELEITDHPVEQGASITDHAFMRPAEVTIRAGWSNSPGSSDLLGSLGNAITGTIGGISSILSGNSVSQIKDIYARFQEMQRSRIPFDIYTGKRYYTNMLVKSLRETTTAERENSMILVIQCRQILIVKPATTGSVTAEPAAQAQPGDTNPTADLGTKQLAPATNYNVPAGDASLNYRDPSTVA